jgi:hypothetical protein
VPVWVAGFPGNLKPLRRAARHDGFFPANLEHPDQLAEIVAAITHLRQHWHRPIALRQGGRRLVAGRVPVGHRVGGPCVACSATARGSLSHEEATPDRSCRASLSWMCYLQGRGHS